MLKPEVDTSLEKISLESGFIKLYRVWSSMVTLNKTLAMQLMIFEDIKKCIIEIFFKKS